MTTLRLPFSGFYETVYGAELDAEMQRVCDENPLEGADPGDFINWKSAAWFIACAYVEAFNGHVNTQWGIDLKLRFAHLKSPREYNFDTDAIYAEVSPDKLPTLLALAERSGKMVEVFEAHLKSRSGFHSFYPHDPAVWRNEPLTDWPPPVASLLLNCLLDSTDIDNLPDDLYDDGVFVNAVDGAIDSSALYDLGASTPRDAKGFPEGITDTSEYVRVYEQINKLKQTGDNDAPGTCF